VCHKSEFKVLFSFDRGARLVLVALSVAIALAGWVLATGVTAAAADSADGGGLDLVVTAVPPLSPAGSADDGAGQPVPCSPGSRLVWLGDGGGHVVLSAGLETACDPAVDPAASRLVFRGRESASAPWRIWQLDLTAEPSEMAGTLRPLTPAVTSCVRPFVLADGGVGFLCDGDVARVGDPAVNGASGEDGDLPAPVRLTSSGGSIDAATVLPDGRFLLTSADAAGRPVLWTSQPDGTWTTRWRDDPIPGLVGVHPLPPDGLLLAVRDSGEAREAGAVPGGGGGHLLLGSLSDPFATLRPVGPAGEAAAASLRDPWPLPGGAVLAAVRPAPGERFRIERWTPGGGEARVVAALDDDLLQPVALVPRPADTQIPSIVKPELNTGYLVLFDAARAARLSRDGSAVDRQAIAAVRVFPWADGPQADSAVDLPPADDGSLYLEVPADRPLGIALVDASGALLGPAGGPLWVRPNERRACMGCHVSRRYAPPNERPQALLEPPRWVGWGAQRVSPRSELEEGSH